MTDSTLTKHEGVASRYTVSAANPMMLTRLLFDEEERIVTTESMMLPLLAILWFDAINDWLEARFTSSASREAPSKRYLGLLLLRMVGIQVLLIICMVQDMPG